MESSEIIEKVFSSEILDKKLFKKDENLFKKIHKYLIGLKFKESIAKKKSLIWKKAGEILDSNSIVFNISTEFIDHDAISYFQKYHGSSIYHIFHGKHAVFVLDINENFFHWTDCYPNMISYQDFSVNSINQALNSIQEKEKIKLIHIGDIDYSSVKNVLNTLGDVLKTNHPYILFENFLEPYAIDEKNSKFSIRGKKFNLFETKKFKAFKDFVNEKNINFDIVCSTIPNDSTVLLKIKS